MVNLKIPAEGMSFYLHSIYNAMTNVMVVATQQNIYLSFTLKLCPIIFNHNVNALFCFFFPLFMLPLGHHRNTSVRQEEIVRHSCSVCSTLRFHPELHFLLMSCSCPSFFHCTSRYSWQHVRCMSGTCLGFH